MDTMADITKEAKLRIKNKGKGRESKLDVNDIKELIIMAVSDAYIDSEELSDLKSLIRYSFDNMDSDALYLYQNFMNGITGKGSADRKYLDIKNEAKAMMMKNKNSGSMLEYEDIRDLIILVIGDGLITKYEVTQFATLNEFYPQQMTPRAGQLFQSFSKGIQRFFATPEIRKQVRDPPPTRSPDPVMQYQQCGLCSGSGNVVCGSCNGMGGRSESRVEYDWDGNPIYRDEWIYCYCSGGYAQCGNCGGSGQVYR